VVHACLCFNVFQNTTKQIKSDLEPRVAFWYQCPRSQRWCWRKAAFWGMGTIVPSQHQAPGHHQTFAQPKGLLTHCGFGISLTGAHRVWSWEAGCRLPTSHRREAFQTCVHQVSFSTFLRLVRPSEAVSWQGTREDRGLSSACTHKSLLPLHSPCKHAKLTYAVSEQNAICRILTLIPSLFKL
uniref:Uncharacterized protein n=1 Tax=Pavo cristatus TaxID=9049 RepID=A0A8C9F3H2_PAVCR